MRSLATAPRRLAAVAAGFTLTLTGALAGLSTAAPAQASVAVEPLQPVASVDVARYVGRWNQLATIPQLYTLQCGSNTTADYAILDADTISVTNTCRTWLGFTSRIKGTADVLDPVTNAQLRVRFPGVPDWGGTTTPNYVITYLADDYSWALVGDPQRRSGFVLSRGVALSEAQWGEVRDVVEDAGYDSCRFITTPTQGGRLDYRQLCRFGG